jgi:serine/threonine-protein phosphatase 2A regulatory subunit B'
VPIKDDHKTMLIKALLPLHKAKAIAAYHPQLSYCMGAWARRGGGLGWGAPSCRVGVAVERF